MNSNTLMLEQIQKMSIDEVINMYKCGYTLSETTEALPLHSTIRRIPANDTYQSHLTDTSQIHHVLHADTANIIPLANTDSHYTSYDIGVIAAAIGISVGLLAIIIRYMIRKEEERIIKEIKDTVASVTQKAGIIERLMPLAEKLGQKIFSPKAQ